MDSVKHECYALVQEIVCARDIFCRGPECRCRSTAGHHIYKRDRLATAFNTKYVLGFCAECHQWAHSNPTEFLAWLLDTMGEEDYYKGLQLSLTIAKHIDFKAVRKSLKKELILLK